MKITIVIPTYNEAENINPLINGLIALPLKLSILIVDDNSPDGTGGLADALAEKYPNRIEVAHRIQKEGLGAAYRFGFKTALNAGADVIGQMDADFSHPIDKLSEMVSELEDADLVLGSRYMPGGSVDKNWPLWRKALSAGGNLYARLILWTSVRDLTGGYKLWRKEVLETIPLDQVKSNGYIFQIEMNYLAAKLGFTVKEIPFYFADRQWGQSKMHWRIAAEAIWRVWQVKFKYLFLKKVK